MTALSGVTFPVQANAGTEKRRVAAGLAERAAPTEVMRLYIELARDLTTRLGFAATQPPERRSLQ